MSQGPIVVALEPWLARHAVRFRDKNLARLPEIRAAGAAGDLDAVRVFGHNLRGMGGTYGMPEVTRLGRMLEEAAPAGRMADVALGLDELEAWLARVTVVDA